MDNDINSLSFKFAVELIGFEDSYNEFTNNLNLNELSCLNSGHLYMGYNPFSFRYQFQERSINIEIVVKNKFFLFSYDGTVIENLLLSSDMDLNKKVIRSVIETIIRMRDGLAEDVSIKDHLTLKSMLNI